MGEQQKLEMQIQVEELEQGQQMLAKEKRRLVAILRGSDAGTWEWNVKTGETEYNDRLAGMLGYTLKEFADLSGKTWQKLVHHDDRGKSEQLLEDHMEGRLDHYKLQCRLRHKDGSWVWVNIRGKVDSRTHDGEPLLMAGTHHDVTDQMQEHQGLLHQRKLQQLVIEISTDFIMANSDNIDGKIDSMLEKLGKFFGVDRCHLFMFSKNAAKLTNTHEWCADGIEPQKKLLSNIDIDSLPWWTKQIMDGRIVNIPDTSRLPDDAGSTEDVLMQQDIKSLLNVPISTNKGVIGALGFDMVRENREWDEDNIDYLKVLANVLAEAEHKLEHERERAALKKQIEGSYSFDDMVSKNREMRRIFNRLPNIAESSAGVLIEGESGTGKELLARAIHNHSYRANKPFVKISCGALPESLLESELFGYKAGAFTDAKKDKPGRFDAADGGTVFLDEIGEMTLNLQVKLLEVLQDGTFMPVGASTPRTCDVRVIAATNKNLWDMVNSGRFRDDLYYRIKVVRLVPPPLRERKEDIPLLVNHIIRKFNRLKNRNVRYATGEVMATLMAQNFPGNVRELENVIEHCFVMCDGEMIEMRHLPPEMQGQGGESAPDEAVDCRPKTLQQMERLMIEEALRRHDGNKTAAAAELGIGKRTLYRRLKEYDIW